MALYPRCSCCCDFPAFYAAPVDKVYEYRPAVSPFLCSGDPDDGKWYLVETFSESLSGPACGGLTDYSFFAATSGWDASRAYNGIFGDDGVEPISNSPTPAGAITVHAGNYLKRVFSSEYTDANLLTDARASFALAADGSSGGGGVGRVDIFDDRPLLGTLHYRVVLTSSKVTLRFKIPLCGKGRCLRLYYQVVEQEPGGNPTPLDPFGTPGAITVLSETYFEWDGEVPMGYDPDDPSTYPVIFTDLVVPLPIDPANTTYWRIKPTALNPLRPDVTFRCSKP